LFGIFYTTAWLVTSIDSLLEHRYYQCKRVFFPLPAADVVNNFNQIMKTLALSSNQHSKGERGVTGESVDRETTIVTDCKMLIRVAQLGFA